MLQPLGEMVALSWERFTDWDECAWRHRAACRDSSPELFFPIGTTGLALDQIAAAKAVCARCPVQAECLDFALASHQEAGVWGGTSEDERRAMRRRQAARARMAPASS